MNRVIANYLFGFVHHRALRLMRNISLTEYYTEEEIQNYQNEKLKKLILIAYQTVPYYRDLFDSIHLKPQDICHVKDLINIPVLTKNIIRQEGDRMFSQNVNKYRVNSTSGSTGQPIVLRKSYNGKEIENALLYRFYRNIGHNYGKRQLQLWGRVYTSAKSRNIENLKNYIYNTELINIYDINDKVLEKILLDLGRRKTDHIRAFSAALYQLAVKAKEKGFYFNIPSMSVSVEQLFTEQREVIEEVFGKNLFNQYGCGEVCSLAFECSEHMGMHHAFEHSVLEILDDDDRLSGSGRVVLTNLDNYAMPFIRYENGDLATLNEKKCRCGRHGKLISTIDGRSFDKIVGINGCIIHGAFIDDIIVRADLLKNSGISQFRFIQCAVNKVRFDYVSPTEISEYLKKDIENLLVQRLGRMEIEFRKCLELPLSNNGKRRFVVSFEEYRKKPELYV